MASKRRLLNPTFSLSRREKLEENGIRVSSCFLSFSIKVHAFDGKKMLQDGHDVCSNLRNLELEKKASML